MLTSPPPLSMRQMQSNLQMISFQLLRVHACTEYNHCVMLATIS